jgi:uncharacterized protein YbaA (DUF1428 family)
MYFQGFVVPVPAGNKSSYLDMARKASPVFAEHGARGHVECWGDDVMDGKVTDFKKAVRASGDETVVLSWVWWPDRATCDAAAGKIMEDDRMRPEGPLPFDGQRMIYGGFEAVFDTGGDARFGYVDGLVASVPDGNHQAFIDHAARMARLFQEKGALRLVDGWGADVPACRATIKVRIPVNQDEKLSGAWGEGRA